MCPSCFRIKSYGLWSWDPLAYQRFMLLSSQDALAIGHCSGADLMSDPLFTVHTVLVQSTKQKKRHSRQQAGHWAPLHHRELWRERRNGNIYQQLVHGFYVMLGIKTITLKSIFIEERKGGSNRRMVLGPVRDPDRGPVLIDQCHLAIKPPSCDKIEGKKTNKMVTVVRKECRRSLKERKKAWITIPWWIFEVSHAWVNWEV